VEVVRTQEEHRLQRHGTCFIRELWREHRIQADVVRESGMTFRETDDTGREMHCPVCFQYRDGTSDITFSVKQRLPELKLSMVRHLESNRHKQELKEQERALLWVVRRNRVGLTIARTALQTLRAGCSYLQFKQKLLDLHLSGLDIGSLNHSKEFIRMFVKSMRATLDRLINDHLQTMYVIAGRKRVFVFMDDKWHFKANDGEMHVQSGTGIQKVI